MSDVFLELTRPSDEPGSAVEAFTHGAQVFGRMFARWMDGNSWSHPSMTALAKAAMGGEGWLHSSQISSLRHASTRNPGPRTFVAIERLNYYLWRYQEHHELIPGTKSSNDYKDATPITEDGQPPTLGWFVEVFCGYRMPKDFDMEICQINPERVERYCRQLGRLLRQLMMSGGLDLVEDLGGVLYQHYPTQEKATLDAVRRIVLGGESWEAAELERELPNLAALTRGLGGPATPDELLVELQ